MLLSTCKKDDGVKLLGPGIMLSTDVQPHHWFRMRDFLKDNNIKITFYINGYQELTDSQIQQMRILVGDGHEMAHHTKTHPNIITYLKQNTLAEYLKTEIVEISDLMKKDGFDPVTFAYPDGEYTTESDQELLKLFYSVRKTQQPYLNKDLEDMDPIYYKYGNLKILNAGSIDRKFKHGLDEVYAALEKAKKSHQCIALYCHFVSYDNVAGDEGAYGINESDIKAVLLRAKSLHLTFYTAADVSRKTF